MGEQKLVYFPMLKLSSSHLWSLWKKERKNEYMSEIKISPHKLDIGTQKYIAIYTRMFSKQKHPKHWTWLALKPYIFFFNCSLAPWKYRNFNQNNRSLCPTTKSSQDHSTAYNNILIKYFRIINNLFRLLQWKKLTKMFSQGIVNQSWTFDHRTPKRA